LRDDALGFVHEAHDVAATDVERHVVEQPAILALYHRRAFDDSDIRQRGKRNERFSQNRVPRCRGV
jgi:hypothetical protein